MSNTELNSIQAIIKSLIVSSLPHGLTVQQLDDDYKEIEGNQIPFYDFGFRQLDAFLNSLSTLKINGFGSSARVLLQPQQEDKTKHIQKLISKQKKQSYNKKRTGLSRNSEPKRSNIPSSITIQSQSTNKSKCINYHNYNNIQQQQQKLRNDYQIQQQRIKRQYQQKQEQQQQLQQQSYQSKQTQQQHVHNQQQQIDNDLIYSDYWQQQQQQQHQNLLYQFQLYNYALQPTMIPYQFNNNVNTNNNYNYCYPNYTNQWNNINYNNVNVNYKHGNITTYKQQLNNYEKSVTNEINTADNKLTEMNLDSKCLNQNMQENLQMPQLVPLYQHVQDSEPFKIRTVFNSDNVDIINRLNNITIPDLPIPANLPTAINTQIINTSLTPGPQCTKLKDDFLNETTKLSERTTLNYDCVDQINVSSDENEDHDENDDDDDFAAIPKLRYDDIVHRINMPKEGYDNFTIPMAKLSDDYKVGSLISIYITEICSPYKFWFHILENCPLIDELMHNIEVFYSNLSKNEKILHPSSVEKGRIVVAYFLDNWHRGEILSNQLYKKKIKIYFIDYGSVADIDINNVKYINKEFTLLPRQAMRGSLYGIKPKLHRWTRDATFTLLELSSDLLLYGKIININMNDHSYSIILTDTNHEYDIVINNELIKRGLAIKMDEKINLNSNNNLNCLSSTVLNSINTQNNHYASKHPSFDMLESGAYPSFADIGLLLSINIDFYAYEDENLDSF